MFSLDVHEGKNKLKVIITHSARMFLSTVAGSRSLIQNVARLLRSFVNTRGRTCFVSPVVRALTVCVRKCIERNKKLRTRAMRSSIFFVVFDILFHHSKIESEKE